MSERSRRRFFEEAAAGGAAALFAGLLSAQTPASGSRAKSDSEDFWGKFFDDVQPGAESRGVESLVSKVVVPKRKVTYLAYNNNRLRYAHEIDKSELLNHSGDVTVSMTLSQFQPGSDDHSSVARNKSAQLRVDCVQTKGFMNVLSPMAWCALASVYTDSASKIPSLASLGFQNDTSLSGANRVILPAGQGKLAVNVSLAKPESMIHKVLKQAVTTGSAVSPLLGLPGMSITALKAFTDIYSYLEARAAFVLNSALTDAAATQQAVDDGDTSASYIPLVNGEYVLVPDSQTAALGDQLGHYKLVQGYLIDTQKVGDKQLPIETMKDVGAPGVTYLTLKVAVSPLMPGESVSQAGAGGATNGQDASADPTGGDPASGAAKSGAGKSGTAKSGTGAAGKKKSQ